MIYIAICDDDRAICSQIETVLLNYAGKVCRKLNIEVFYSGEDLLMDIEKGSHYDLIYLDIELTGMNGVDVGWQFRNVFRNYRTEIVYISGKDGYDRQLFDVQPLHFIAKPIDPSIVIADLELALERHKHLSGFFQYKKGFDTCRVPIQEIVYFESRNREVRMVTVWGEAQFYRTLGDVAAELAYHPFVQIHRSYLINYNHASVLRYAEVIMSNGDILPISKTKRKEFRSLQINEI